MYMWDRGNNEVDFGTSLINPDPIKCTVKRGVANYLALVYKNTDNKVVGYVRRPGEDVVECGEIKDLPFSNLLHHHGHDNHNVVIGGLNIGGDTRLSAANIVDGASHGWKGVIDEVAVYNRALPATELQEHVDAAKATTTAAANCGEWSGHCFGEESRQADTTACAGDAVCKTTCCKAATKCGEHKCSAGSTKMSSVSGETLCSGVACQVDCCEAETVAEAQGTQQSTATKCGEHTCIDGTSKTSAITDETLCNGAECQHDCCEGSTVTDNAATKCGEHTCHDGTSRKGAVTDDVTCSGDACQDACCEDSTSNSAQNCAEHTCGEGTKKIVGKDATVTCAGFTVCQSDCCEADETSTDGQE